MISLLLSLLISPTFTLAKIKNLKTGSTLFVEKKDKKFCIYEEKEDGNYKVVTRHALSFPELRSAMRMWPRINTLLVLPFGFALGNMMFPPIKPIPPLISPQNLGPATFVFLIFETADIIGNHKRLKKIMSPNQIQVSNGYYYKVLDNIYSKKKKSLAKNDSECKNLELGNQRYHLSPFF